MPNIFDTVTPALDNLPVFYAMAISLLAMLVVIAARVQRAWVRVAAVAPLWVMLGIWAAIGAIAVAFVGAMAGWVLLIVGPLLVIAAFGLISWGIVRWVRINVVADVFVAVAIVAFGAWVWVFQTAWMCQPLAGSGVGYAQLCTARLYRDGAGGVIRDRSAAG
ncbi:MAG: hypothetical protein O7H39_11995, partial [Gammaproteobacteria bacterium]|nr:hypothetical protein [Gammaproteobacteria bacterium]